VKPANPRVLTINGGSSSIKFAQLGSVIRSDGLRNARAWRLLWNTPTSGGSDDSISQGGGTNETTMQPSFNG